MKTMTTLTTTLLLTWLSAVSIQTAVAAQDCDDPSIDFFDVTQQCTCRGLLSGDGAQVGTTDLNSAQKNAKGIQNCLIAAGVKAKKLQKLTLVTLPAGRVDVAPADFGQTSLIPFHPGYYPHRPIFVLPANVSVEGSSLGSDGKPKSTLALHPAPSTDLSFGRTHLFLILSDLAYAETVYRGTRVAAPNEMTYYSSQSTCPANANCKPRLISYCASSTAGTLAEEQLTGTSDVCKFPELLKSAGTYQLKNLSLVGDRVALLNDIDPQSHTPANESSLIWSLAQSSPSKKQNQDIVLRSVVLSEMYRGANLENPHTVRVLDSHFSNAVKYALAIWNGRSEIEVPWDEPTTPGHGSSPYANYPGPNSLGSDYPLWIAGNTFSNDPGFIQDAVAAAAAGKRNGLVSMIGFFLEGAATSLQLQTGGSNPSIALFKNQFLQSSAWLEQPTAEVLLRENAFRYSRTAVRVLSGDSGTPVGIPGLVRLEQNYIRDSVTGIQVSGCNGFFSAHQLPNPNGYCEKIPSLITRPSHINGTPLPQQPHVLISGNDVTHFLTPTTSSDGTSQGDLAYLVNQFIYDDLPSGIGALNTSGIQMNSNHIGGLTDAQFFALGSYPAKDNLSGGAANDPSSILCRAISPSTDVTIAENMLEPRTPPSSSSLIYQPTLPDWSFATYLRPVDVPRANLCHFKVSPRICSPDFCRERKAH